MQDWKYQKQLYKECNNADKIIVAQIIRIHRRKTDRIRNWNNLLHFQVFTIICNRKYFGILTKNSLTNIYISNIWAWSATHSTRFILIKTIL